MKKSILSFLTAACFSILPSIACTNLIVTKGASQDGSVMFTYAADSYTRYGTLVHYPAARHHAGELRTIRQWGQDKYLGVIPEADRTFNVIGNMNEHQLAIGETTWGGRPEYRDPDAVLDYGSLIYICLQRTDSARKAIEMFTSLADEYGYASSGESITFADKNEVWILEIIARKPLVENGINLRKGAVWVAVRIPDGCISAHANSARIAQFPLNDPDNCIYAADVISHARETGIYEGSDEDFSFADTYCPLTFSLMRACEARVWSFFNRYAEEDMSKYVDFASGDNPSNRMPLYVTPKMKLSVTDLAEMMRDHYEGTPFDMTLDVGAGGNHTPYRWKNSDWSVDGVKYCNERPICTQQTGFWFVAQCRSWLPDEIGGIFWFAVDDAGTSALTPVYACSTEISEHYAFGNGRMLEYSPTSMFWLNNRIAQFAYLRYDCIGAEVRERIRDHEKLMLEKTAISDAEAMALYAKSSKKAVKYLTRFSVSEADALFDEWNSLDKYLLLKYMDGTVKKQNPDGSFISNGSVDYIPVSPDWPGYSEKFKKSIVNDNGAWLKVR